MNESQLHEMSRVDGWLVNQTLSRSNQLLNTGQKIIIAHTNPYQSKKEENHSLTDKTGDNIQPGSYDSIKFEQITK